MIATITIVFSCYKTINIFIKVCFIDCIPDYNYLLWLWTKLPSDVFDELEHVIC